MNDILLLQDKLNEISLTKFSIEEQIESINHQLEMSLYRKENGEKADYLWLNKAKYKQSMLKIELKKINLEYEKTKKELAAFYKSQTATKNMRVERVFMNLIKEDFGEELFFKYVERAKDLVNNY